MRPTALLLCGLPFSGKSSLARALAADGYSVISLDAINNERGFGLHGESVPGAEWMTTHGIALERLRTEISRGSNVVWDDTNYAAWIRDPIFEAALEAGAMPVIVFVDTPAEIVKQRADRSASLGDRPACPSDDFVRVLRDFERPACGVHIDGTMPPEQALKTLVSALAHEKPAHSESKELQFADDLRRPASSST